MSIIWIANGEIAEVSYPYDMAKSYLCNTTVCVSHPYEIAAQLCHTDDLLYHPYDKATLFMSFVWHINSSDEYELLVVMWYDKIVMKYV